jgi:hypothetical protein
VPLPLTGHAAPGQRHRAASGAIAPGRRQSKSSRRPQQGSGTAPATGARRPAARREPEGCPRPGIGHRCYRPTRASAGTLAWRPPLSFLPRVGRGSNVKCPRRISKHVRCPPIAQERDRDAPSTLARGAVRRGRSAGCASAAAFFSALPGMPLTAPGGPTRLESGWKRLGTVARFGDARRVAAIVPRRLDVSGAIIALPAPAGEADAGTRRRGAPESQDRAVPRASADARRTPRSEEPSRPGTALSTVAGPR